MNGRWIVLAVGAAGWGCLPAATAGPAPENGSTIRVGVAVNETRVTVAATGPTNAATARGEQYTLGAGERITVEQRSGQVWVATWGADAGAWVRLVPRDDYPTVQVGDRVYRGAVELIPADGGVTAVNVVRVEDYLPSVVGAEMGTRRENEQAAVDAQAVASRTYALSNRGKNASSGFDLRADQSDQVYRGVSSENDMAWAAVRATAGRVLVYNGQLITAFFHSTCGPRTASPSEVFRTGVDVPYLRPVSDERPGGGYYGDASPYFRWEVVWSPSELRSTLQQTVPDVLGLAPEQLTEIHDVRVVRRGASGRAIEVHINVPAGSIPVFGADIRTVFRTPEGNVLRTNAVEFTATQGADGLGLRAVGHGFGHGVGLCQWGAIGRSRAGQNYRTIVEAYYPGVSIERWN